jgi:ribosomal-protein-alanine N-acetyltransferase
MAAAQQEMQSLVASIRPMRETDLPVVAALERSAYQFPWTEGIFRDCLRVGYVCRVIELGRADEAVELIGYGILSVGAGEAHVLNLCVAAEFRCRGFGRLMLGHLIDRARGFGARDAFLEVRPSNTTAIRLYQSMGFEQIGVRRGYYQATAGREDAVVLKLELKPGGKAAPR